MQPFISIIIPVYNVEHYVAKCIESILAQTFEHFECLVIDDGSTDQSAAIISQAIQQDPRFRLFTQTNQGQGAARNSGLEQAQGDYVCFVDSDDYIDKHYLQKTRERCISDGSVICSFNYQEIDNRFNRKRLATVHDSQTVDIDLVGDSLTRANFFNSACFAIYHRSLFTGIRFPTGAFEDTSPIMALLLKHQGVRISMLDDILYFYTVRTGSTTKAPSFQKTDDALNMLNTLQAILCQYNVQQELKKEFDYFYMIFYLDLISLTIQYSTDYRSQIRYLRDHSDKSILNIRSIFLLYFDKKKINLKRLILWSCLLKMSPMPLYYLRQLKRRMTLHRTI